MNGRDVRPSAPSLPSMNQTNVGVGLGALVSVTSPTTTWEERRARSGVLWFFSYRFSHPRGSDLGGEQQQAEVGE
ncbi:hypothetical protein BDZ97DRAFT_1799254 [Flammula alnicola]|nr:hypothetical protein BDZ97DRAFT_1864596 [Flammula alnicola]KAF8955649.1 hypothetical protein BDZ97DRAFT_1856510 [Flammula alnicola]KAF8963316.1 hypothetical protein BDZ97DRAFT_1821597 [Flammula alnicola]KAF8964584.1 hypothetical protein BDZ97DRAFT_1815760 [Flammula alnicola]KAF8964822.1 hypothetical protein BDZ97DRAFT_1814681 [Flammula alnicola]